MTRSEAIALLDRLRHAAIRTVYDRRPDVREALVAILPSFEYPDHDWKTVAEFLREYGDNSE